MQCRFDARFTISAKHEIIVFWFWILQHIKKLSKHLRLQRVKKRTSRVLWFVSNERKDVFINVNMDNINQQSIKVVKGGVHDALIIS